MFANLIGAAPDEVVATGTTTVNIHQLVNTFYRPSGKRKKIIADELDFPSDIYALKSVLQLRGMNPDEALILAPSSDGRFLDEDEIIKLMGEKGAETIVCLASSTDIEGVSGNCFSKLKETTTAPVCYD